MTPTERHAAYLAALDRLIEAEKAATPGPWRTHDTYLNVGGYTATVLSGEGSATDLRAWLPTRSSEPWDEKRNVWNDAELIAALRNGAVRSLAGRRSILVRHAPEWLHTWNAWVCAQCAVPGLGDHVRWEDCPDYRDAASGLTTIEDRIEASSLGTPEAKALRDSVPDETARRIVARSKEIAGDAAAGLPEDPDAR